MKRGPRPFSRFTILLLPLLATAGNPARGQTNFTVLKSFSGFPDGALPLCSPVTDGNSVLYGTTEAGGLSNAGTIFRIRKDGTGFAVLKDFLVSDGGYPFASLVLSTGGRLFGTTLGGGSSNLGTIFSLNRDGSGFSLLHSFLGGGDGQNPRSAIIQATDGALYGVTPSGNSSAQGTIFKINPDGTGYSVIFAFPGLTSGVQPYGRLLEGSDGLLYGTTIAGGTPGGGVVFGIAKDGSGYNILHNFGGSADGGIPSAGLIEASGGVLYGTTSRGGSGNAGTVFSVSRDGSGYGILRSFSATGGDAAFPQSELIESSDGVLYGSAQSGGAAGYGATFSMNKDGSGYAILRSFLGPSVDGDTPSSLLQLSNGVFCGTTMHGAGDVGSVFALSSSPLPPRILSQSLSGTSNLLQFAMSAGIAFDLQRSTNLTSWQMLATLLSATNGNSGFSDTNTPQPAAFYRLRQH